MTMVEYALYEFMLVCFQVSSSIRFIRQNNRLSRQTAT